VIGESHGLQRLQDTLTALTEGQAAQQTRDTQFQAQLASQATAMAQMGRGLQWLRWGLGALVVVVLGLSGLVGWQLGHPPDMVYARAVGALDATLLQQWPALPKGTQEQLTSVYDRLGLPSPGERQPSRK
jgi:hypothetical protein